MTHKAGEAVRDLRPVFSAAVRCLRAMDSLLSFGRRATRTSLASPQRRQSDPSAAVFSELNQAVARVALSAKNLDECRKLAAPILSRLGAEAHGVESLPPVGNMFVAKGQVTFVERDGEMFVDPKIDAFSNAEKLFEAISDVALRIHHRVVHDIDVARKHRGEFDVVDSVAMSATYGFLNGFRAALRELTVGLAENMVTVGLAKKPRQFIHTFSWTSYREKSAPPSTPATAKRGSPAPSEVADPEIATGSVRDRPRHSLPSPDPAVLRASLQQLKKMPRGKLLPVQEVKRLYGLVKLSVEAFTHSSRFTHYSAGPKGDWQLPKASKPKPLKRDRVSGKYVSERSWPVADVIAAMEAWLRRLAPPQH